MKKPISIRKIALAIYTTANLAAAATDSSWKDITLGDIWSTAKDAAATVSTVAKDTYDAHKDQAAQTAKATVTYTLEEGDSLVVYTRAKLEATKAGADIQKFAKGHKAVKKGGKV